MILFRVPKFGVLICAQRCPSLFLCLLITIDRSDDRRRSYLISRFMKLLFIISIPIRPALSGFTFLCCDLRGI
ncbi:hypothetical protein M5689_011311 [Euphorbia peplus]|nr:hypothetical protein M5689_011311 [Euphorbia peplus]